MNTDRTACIAGVFEHPTRHAPDTSVIELHAECARGALADAGLTLRDVDGYFGGRDVPGTNVNWFIDYLGLDVTHIDATDTGGSSPLVQIAHARDAIASGRCSVALITLAGRPRSERMGTGTMPRPGEPERPDSPWEIAYGPTITTLYAMMMARHAHDYGTTLAEFAAVRVAMAAHAQHNPHAMFRDPVSLDTVMASPVVADPLRRMDCCVISDGGGAVVLVNAAIARQLQRPEIRVLGSGVHLYSQRGGAADLTTSGAAVTGPRALADAGVSIDAIRYASIYDNFTVMVLMQLEDLGFCKKGHSGPFAADGNLLAGQGRIAVNTDGGGLCNNHPSNRGGITKVIEAVRQLRGEAHPAVQIADLELALACGPGGSIGSGHAHATVILGRER